VALLHGWAGYRIGPHRMLVGMSRRLANAGFHALRFDMRGRGDSEGNGETACLDEMIEDALAAVEFLNEKTGIKEAVLAGICSGSNVAIGAATLQPDIRELALWSVLPFQPEQKAAQRLKRSKFYLAEYARKALKTETWRRLWRGEVSLRGVGRALRGDAKPASGERNLKDSSRDIMAAFAKYKGRALFVTGSADPEGMEGRKLFSAFCQAQGIRADFHFIEGATHSYYSTAHEKEVIDVTLDWLAAKDSASP
jgi:pimeloyl-ACP methyl ester carboxylesterase